MPSSPLVLMLILSTMTLPVSCTDEPVVDPTPYLVAEDKSPSKTQSGTGVLNVRLFPIAGAVYIDRKLIGTAGQGQTLKIELAAGLHDLLVTRSGCHDHVSKIRIKAGETRSAVVSLLPIRQHLPHDSHRRTIRPGMTARGQITLRGPLAKDVFEEMKLKVKPLHEEARCVRIELEHVQTQKLTVRVAAFGSKIHAMVVDDQGKVMVENQAKSWSPRLSFTPVKGRTYSVLLAHVAMAKNDFFNLVRYSVYVTPVIARKK